MTRAAILALVRRRINEVTPDAWTDVALNALINVAYVRVVKQVRRVEPGFLIDTVTANIVAGTNAYVKPTGARKILKVCILSAPGGTYSPIEPKTWEVAREWTSTPYVWANRGERIELYPTPTANLAAGIQYHYAPDIEIDTAAAGDAIVPRVDLSLQFAIAVWAAMMVKGESPEADTKEASELAQLLGDIPNDYGDSSADRPPSLSIDINSLPGPGWNRSANDVWPR